MALNIENYPDYIVTIYNTKTAESIAGLLDNEDVSYSSSADLGNNSFIGGAADVLKGAGTQLLRKGFGDYGGDILADRAKTIQNKFQTMVSYEGGNSSVPPITFHVFPENGSYKNILRKLYKYTQPNTESDILIKSYLYDPTDVLKIDTDSGDPFEGKLLHLTIGEWFHATGLFCKNVDLRFSKYVDNNKVPIYLEVGLTFQHHIVQNAEQLVAMIR